MRAPGGVEPQGSSSFHDLSIIGREETCNSTTIHEPKCTQATPEKYSGFTVSYAGFSGCRDGSAKKGFSVLNTLSQVVSVPVYGSVALGVMAQLPTTPGTHLPGRFHHSVTRSEQLARGGARKGEGPWTLNILRRKP